MIFNLASYNETLSDLVRDLFFISKRWRKIYHDYALFPRKKPWSRFHFQEVEKVPTIHFILAKREMFMKCFLFSRCGKYVSNMFHFDEVEYITVMFTNSTKLYILGWCFLFQKVGNASIIYIILFLQNGNNILSAESFLYPRSETCTCRMLNFSMLYFIEVVSLVWFGFITHDQFGFSSMGSRCHCNEWVWNSRTKLCWIASGKWNDSRLSLY